MAALVHQPATIRTAISSRLFAVKADSSPVKTDTLVAIVGFQLNFNTLAKASIMGLYKR